MPPVADTFAQIRTDLLDRAGEDPADVAGDFYATAERQLLRAWHEICNAHPYLWLRVFPPGVFRTVAPITAGTVLVTNGSTVITFSSAPAVSVRDREIRITGWNEAFRIASHVAGAAVATLDSAFNGATQAAANYTVFQREYQLSPTLPIRHFVSMIVADGGHRVEQKSEGWLRENYPDPPDAVWPPQWYARITEDRIRFEGYPDRVRRIEFAYTQIPVDIDTGTILMPRNFRFVITDGGLYWLYLVKNDSRADAAGILYAGGREQLIADDLRKKSELTAGAPARGPYG